MIRILVCGGRAFGDLTQLETMPEGFAKERLRTRIAEERSHGFWCLHVVRIKYPDLVIIHGGAKGADSLADEFGKAQGLEVIAFPISPADWAKHGRRAGPIRNRQMLAAGGPNAVVAFPGGRGTANMIQLAKDKGIPVWEPLER